MVIKMLPILRRFAIMKNTKHLPGYFNSYKLLMPETSHFISGNYSNFPVFTNLNPCQRKYKLSYACGINFLSQHNEAEIKVLDSRRKFEDLFKNIGGDLSVDQIRSYVNDITLMLEDLAFEEHHGSELLNDQSFTKFFRAINRAMDELPSDILINILNICFALHIPLNSEVCFKMIKKLNDGFEDLGFAAKVDLYGFSRFLNFSLNNPAVIKRIEYIDKAILKDIRRNVYLNSPENTAAALCFVHHNRFVTAEDEENVLNAVLALKDWNNSIIFKYFFKTTSRLKSNCSPQMDLYNKFLNRIRHETRCSHLHHFLINYSKAVELNIIEYDRNLVDDITSRLLMSRLKTLQVKNMIIALLELKHVHSGFMEFLMNWLMKNPSIYGIYPNLSGFLISYISSYNNFIEDKSRWATVQSFLRKNPNLIKMLQYKRKDSREPYMHALIDLASLEIFIDKDLIYISDYIKRRNIGTFSIQFLRSLVMLHQSVKLFHPNFPASLLCIDDISTATQVFYNASPSKLMKKKFLFLKDAVKHLEAPSGVTSSILTTVVSKNLGLEIDGVVAVNSEGQLYDFAEYGCRDLSLYLEDISIPKCFKCICLLPVVEEEYARNSLCLRSHGRLRLKILEGLGFPTILLYESIFKNLNDDEKGNYLYKMILEKLSKRNKVKSGAI